MRLLRIVYIGVALLALAAPVSSAETYDPTTLTAPEIFRNARAAYGVLIEGSYTETWITHSGGVDWTYVNVMHDGDTKTTATSGQFTRSWGAYQQQVWAEDTNGIVTLRSQFHSKENPNALALSHADDPKYNVHVLGITQTDPKQYVVEINPPDGFDEFRYYDANTWLLSQVVSYARDRHKHVTEYGDYRKTYGMMVPYRVHSYDGRADNDTVTTIESYTAGTSNADLSIPAGHALFDYAGTQPLRLPATFTGDGIIVRADVNGRGLDFLLDSGASTLTLDPGIAHELGIVPYGRNSATIGGGDVDYGLARVPKMTIGDLELDNVVFDTTPFNRQVGDARVVGLMGFDFLASGILGIDFAKQTLTLYPRAGFDPRSLGLTGLPLQLDDGVPRTDVSIEGVRGRFLIDTGAFNMVVYRDFARALPSVTNLGGDQHIVTVGGAMQTSVVSVANLIFGGIDFRSAKAIEPSTSTFDILDYDGLLGRDILHNYLCYFDYANGTLYVKPNL